MFCKFNVGLNYSLRPKDVYTLALSLVSYQSCFLRYTAYSRFSWKNDLKGLDQSRAAHPKCPLCWFSFFLSNIYSMRISGWGPVSTLPMTSDGCINSVPDNLSFPTALWIYKQYSPWLGEGLSNFSSFFHEYSILSFEIFKWFNLANFFHVSSHPTVFLE